MTAMEKQLRAAHPYNQTRAPKLTKEDNAYTRLLAEYALLADIRDPESVLAGEGFTVDGVDFRLIRRSRVAPALVFLLCDLGPVPEGQEAACYRALLEANMWREDRLSSTLAICPETGWMVCSVRLPLLEINAELLHGWTRVLVKEAQDWRASSARALGNASFVPPQPGKAANAQPYPPYNEAFIRLLVDYCSVNRLDGVEPILLGAPLLIQNIPFVFSGFVPTNPRIIQVYCDYGALPEGENTEDICHALLVANLTLHPAAGQALILSAETDHILLAQHFQPEVLKPRSLQFMLEKMAEASLRWRESFR